MRQWSLDRWPDNGTVDLNKALPLIKQEIVLYRAMLEAEETHAAQNGQEDFDI
jgi:hypothetical protein